MKELEKAKKVFDHWLSSDCFDSDTKKELMAIAGDDREILERFGKDLEFGTGGMRGILGAGINRINRYTVRRATYALAQCLKETGDTDKGVVIAYDSRFGSREFSLEAAMTLNACGIPAYRFESLRPTPELSFTVRKLGCLAGIVITASHNPAEYNGYKVYWQDGGQITLTHAREIMKAYEEIHTFEEIPVISIQEAKEQGLFHEIGEEIDSAYYEAVMDSVIHPELAGEYGPALRIVYTPLHGTGRIPVMKILADLGFDDVHVVKEQEDPDGSFATCEYPNPEAREAWNLALKLAERIHADLVLATDPDADRLGLWVPDDRGTYHFFNGNMTGILLADYILKEKKNSGTLPDNAAIGKTIVSSQMAVPLAEKYGVRLFETLTGFKFIGEKIQEFEESGESCFVFGFEESFGCLAGTAVRDKDAVQETALLCEAAAFYHSKGKTLLEVMEDLYREYGWFLEGQTSVSFQGISGKERMKQIMEQLRSHPLKEIAGKKTLAIRDYKTGIRTDLESGEKKKLDLPSSNVLYYELEKGWCAVRPSGTEPKIKFYFGTEAAERTAAEEERKAMKQALKEIGA